MTAFGTDWENWKKSLGQAVEFAAELGIDQKRINPVAQQVGEFLAQNVTPANPEQKAIKELWEVADQEEKQTLSNLMVRLVSKK
jgi:uncharacterized protein YaeQ